VVAYIEKIENVTSQERAIRWTRWEEANGAGVRGTAVDCIEYGRRKRDAVKGARKMTGFPRS
jgi:hypothetical protein